MTLITRLKGNTVTYIAADDQINKRDNTPWPAEVGQGNLQKRKLFIPASSNMAFSMSNFLSSDKIDLRLEVIDLVTDKTYASPDDLCSDISYLLHSIVDPSFNDKSVEFLISGATEGRMKNLTLQKLKGVINLNDKPIELGLFCQTSVEKYCKYYDKQLEKYIETSTRSDLINSVDFNFSYIPQDNGFSYDSHPVLLYTTLIIVASESSVDLTPASIDALTKHEATALLSSFYNKLIELRDNKDLRLFYESGLLRTFGPLALITKTDLSSSAYILNSEID